MGILSEFERRVGGAIEGAFAKAFRTGLHPRELATRVLREMETNKTVGVRDVWVPNRYLFGLSPPDRERFEHTERALKRELEQLVLDAAKERGWSLVGPPEVSFETDESVAEGRFGCSSMLVEGQTGWQEALRRPAGDPRRGRTADAELVLVERGRPTQAFPLDRDRLVIGRLGDSDVVLADPGVSRRHAEVRRDGGGYRIADLGSTNGTLVNESTIGEHALQDGDRIRIGKTVLEFRRR